MRGELGRGADSQRCAGSEFAGCMELIDQRESEVRGVAETMPLNIKRGDKWV
jgi:hypothetical protein